MTTRIIENNKVTIIGKIISHFKFDHSVFGEDFYMFDVAVRRLSNTIDYIPVMTSNRLLDVTANWTGRYISISGNMRSFNLHTEDRTHLKLSVFAREIELLQYDITEDDRSESNKIYLEGYICKEPIHRETPSGREITDLFIAVNRPYGKSDYLPCICWGRNAKLTSNFKVGDSVQVLGRIQSREYMKKISDMEAEKRIAYEISLREVKRLSV